MWLLHSEQNGVVLCVHHGARAYRVLAHAPLFNQKFEAEAEDDVSQFVETELNAFTIAVIPGTIRPVVHQRSDGGPDAPGLQHAVNDFNVSDDVRGRVDEKTRGHSIVLPWLLGVYLQ